MNKYEKIIEFFENNEDTFIECIEELDSYNGYLNDDRYYEMELLNEFYNSTEPLDILYRTFYGYDADNYTFDSSGNKTNSEFNPNREYFKYNGYGNLVSTNYKDYSDKLDIYFIDALIENKEEINEVKLSELQAEAENILKNYCDRESIKLSIIPSSRAYYQPSLDSIAIPTKEQYTNLNEYLSTMAHECVHSTGAKHRLNRDLSGGMGTKSYSKEELVAEMGAALVLASKGIEDADTEKNSVAYLRGWVSKLKDDITFITFAAQRAQKATNLILGEDKE